MNWIALRYTDPYSHWPKHPHGVHSRSSQQHLSRCPWTVSTRLTCCYSTGFHEPYSYPTLFVCRTLHTHIAISCLTTCNAQTPVQVQTWLSLACPFVRPVPDPTTRCCPLSYPSHSCPFIGEHISALTQCPSLISSFDIIKKWLWEYCL